MCQSPVYGDAAVTSCRKYTVRKFLLLYLPCHLFIKLSNFSGDLFIW